MELPVSPSLFPHISSCSLTITSSGIGRATAIVLAKRGFSVIIADVSVESGETAVEEIVKGGGKAKFSRLDVGSAEEWESAGQFVVCFVLG